MSEQIFRHNACPECGSTTLAQDFELGEAACCHCGLVIHETALDRGAEWRAFTQKERERRTRTGAPTRYSTSDKGLSTTIQVNRDAFGRKLSPRMRRKMWRLRRWHIRSSFHTAQDRNLSKAMNELQRLSEKLHVPSSVQEMAAVIYRKALNEGLVRGRIIAGMVAGALYAACRLAKIPRTLKEVSKVSLRDKKEVSRAYRIIIQNLKMKMPVDDPVDYVTKIAETAGTSSEVEGVAIKLIQIAKAKKAIMGKDPSGLAAAALYIASRIRNEKIKQHQLAKAANITEVTIRNRKKDLIKRLDLGKKRTAWTKTARDMGLT